jgi:hypothetical protein
MTRNYPKLKEVTTLDNYSLLLLFTNGKKKLFDFTPNLSHPYYKDLRNISLFRSVVVNDGEIEWSTGQDFCPHTLYDKSVDYTE